MGGLPAGDHPAERYDRYVGPIMAPFVDALLDAAVPMPGHTLLDVACGTGFAARSAAKRVGLSGRVTGIDLDAAALEVAARRSAGGQPPIEWRRTSADNLPFSEATFDSVVCQQGLQFVPRLQATVAEAARVTRTAGRVAATVWSPIDRSPYWIAWFRSVNKVLGPGATAPPSLQPSRFIAAFRAASLREVHTKEVVADVHLPLLADSVRGHLMATGAGRAVSAARPDGLDVAADFFVDQLMEWTNPDGSATIPFSSLLITGLR